MIKTNIVANCKSSCLIKSQQSTTLGYLTLESKQEFENPIEIKILHDEYQSYIQILSNIFKQLITIPKVTKIKMFFFVFKNFSFCDLINCFSCCILQSGLKLNDIVLSSMNMEVVYGIVSGKVYYFRGKEFNLEIEETEKVFLEIKNAIENV